MKKKFLFALTACFLFILTSCLNGPAIEEVYKNDSRQSKKESAGKILIYKICVEGDNYDPMIEKILLDKVKIFFKKLNAQVELSENVFVNEQPDKPLNIQADLAETDYDNIFILQVKVKNIGFSMKTLTQEWSIFLNISLYEANGELKFSTLSTKTTSYNLSAGKKLHRDLANNLFKVKNFLHSKQTLLMDTKQRKDYEKS